MGRAVHPHIITDDSALGGSTVERSLRFNGADATAHLTRTPSTSGNRKVWTFSAWIKKSHTDDGPNYIYAANNGNTSYVALYFRYNKLYTYFHPTNNYGEVSSRFFRDVGSWFHLIHQVDAGDFGQKIWINGEALSLNSGRNPSNTEYGWNQSGVAQRVGNASWRNDNIDGYLSDVYHIDGQLKFPSDFGYTDFQTGLWRPKKYKGTYGTNGFHLEFKDNTNNAALGLDTSGQGNNFTVNNISSSHDSLPDAPTNNFATLNALDFTGGSLLEGNLKQDNSSATNTSATFGMQSGKWYWEIYFSSASGGVFGIGIGESRKGSALNDLTRHYGYSTNGQFYTTVNGSSNAASYGNSLSAGDIVGVKFDADTRTLEFLKNNSSQGTNNTPASGYLYLPAFHANNADITVNFGQDSTFAGATSSGGNKDASGLGDFKYPVPSGYRALCSNNLPVITTPTILKPEQHFTTVTWTGDGTNNRTIPVTFRPDFVWLKARGATYDHRLWNTLTPTHLLMSNNTSTETTTYNAFNVNDDGIRVWASVNNNNSSQDYVAWCWKAGGAAVSNSDGTITSSVSANTEAGFSIVSYTGNETNNATVGHGLGKSPDCVIIKDRDSNTAGNNWYVFHSALASGHYVKLNQTSASAAVSGTSNGGVGSVTSTTFNFVQGTSGNNKNVNENGDNFIAYCWTSIPGYSKFGSYKGNGSTDGTFVYLGFRVAWLLVKGATNSDDWALWDIAREPTNVNGIMLRPNATSTDGYDSGHNIDLLSNGFKLRNTDSKGNANAQEFIYLAFAEKSGVSPYRTETNAR